MELFEKFMARHGEVGLQALIENWERAKGIRHSNPVPLEQRWHNFMQEGECELVAA